MHAVLPLRKVSFPGRDRWDAATCGHVKGEGPAIAPSTADATSLARPWCALSATKDASRAAVFACSILRQTDVGVLRAGGSSGWRRRAPAGPTPTHMPSSSGRRERPDPGSSGGGARRRAESLGGGGDGSLSSAGRPAGVAPSGLARAGVETPPSPVEFVRFLRYANRRVHPLS